MVKGVQQYTVRNFTGSAQALRETCNKIKQTGYTVLHGWKPDGMALENYHSILRESGLTSLTVEEDMLSMLVDDAAIEIATKDAELLGTRYVGVGTMPLELRGSESGFVTYARMMNQVGARLHKHGLSLCYHCHALEFLSLGGGRVGMDVLLSQTDPASVCFVLDTHWLAAAGVNPPDWIRKAKGRLAALHVKDYAIALESDDVGHVGKRFAEVGEGNLDWPPIFEACRDTGVDTLIVEQDECVGDPFESLAISYRNLVKFGV